MTTFNLQFRLTAMLLTAVLVFTLRAAPATSRPAAPEQNLVQWVADLDAASPTVRSAAAASLLQLSRDQLPALRRVIERSRPLSPGQTLVLHDVVVHVWLTEEPYDKLDRGFLGMNLLPVNPWDEPGPGREGILVVSRMPGFAAYGALLDSDVVLAIKEVPGVRFSQSSEFAEQISSLRPGTPLHLVVLRQGQQIVVPLRLSARPAAAGDGIRGGGRADMDALISERLQAAEAYYEKNFAPLMGEALSRAD